MTLHMAGLIAGVLIWAGAHLFKRLLPAQRAKLGDKARPAVALSLVIALLLMIFGYRGAETTDLYALHIWAWYLNNILMLAGGFMMNVGHANGIAASKIRHPMLAGVALWALAHVLVNGDTVSLMLFGGLGLWALVEMRIISRAEGPWQAPEPGPLRKDLISALGAVAIYAVIVGIHYWAGFSVFVLF